MEVSGFDDTDALIEEEQNPHETPEKEILWATDNSDYELVKKILEEKPSCVNSADSDGYTALHKAAYNDNYELAQLLLKYNANVNALTEFKWTPLHSACKWNKARLAGLLLQHGANVNALSDGNQTPLHIATTVSNCRESVTTLLMDNNIKPNLLNVSNETAEEIARRTGLTQPIFKMSHSAFSVETGII